MSLDILRKLLHPAVIADVEQDMAKDNALKSLWAASDWITKNMDVNEEEISYLREI